MAYKSLPLWGTESRERCHSSEETWWPSPQGSVTGTSIAQRPEAPEGVDTAPIGIAQVTPKVWHVVSRFMSPGPMSLELRGQPAPCFPKGVKVTGS